MTVRKVAIKSQWLLEFLGSSAGEGSSVVTAVTKKKKRRRRRRRKKKDQWLIRKFYLTHVFTTWSPLETGTEPCIYFLLPSLPQLYSTKPLQFICQEAARMFLLDKKKIKKNHHSTPSLKLFKSFSFPLFLFYFIFAFF